VRTLYPRYIERDRKKYFGLWILAIIFAALCVFLIGSAIRAPRANAQKIDGPAGAEDQPFKVFGLKGGFHFEQNDNKFLLRTKASGRISSKRIHEICYKAVLKRRPLGSKRSWRVVKPSSNKCASFGDRFMTSFLREANWTVTTGGTLYEYRLDAKLKVTARDGTVFKRSFHPQTFPV
jgi:hypothetical protein